MRLTHINIAVIEYRFYYYIVYINASFESNISTIIIISNNNNVFIHLTGNYGNYYRYNIIILLIIIIHIPFIHIILLRVPGIH